VVAGEFLSHHDQVGDKEQQHRGDAYPVSGQVEAFAACRIFVTPVFFMSGKWLTINHR